MRTASPLVFALCFLLAAPAARAAPGFDLAARFDARFDRAVERAHAERRPDEKRAVLDDAFGDMLKALDRIARAPGLSDASALHIAGLQQDLQSERHRLNGTGGTPRIPNADLDRFADDAQQGLALQDRTITLSLTTALLILIILILLL